MEVEGYEMMSPFHWEAREFVEMSKGVDVGGCVGLEEWLLLGDLLWRMWFRSARLVVRSQG